MRCAKSLLTGKYEEPGAEAGSKSDLNGGKGEKIGEVLRTKVKTKPMFISPGNLITQEECTELMMRCVTKYRVPEPTRQAHLLVNEARMDARG
jgi:deoxyribonuclease V